MSVAPILSRVLVVDDDRLIRASLRQALADAGYLVEEASHVRQALALASKGVPDLVLLDYRLPDTDGMEALRELQKLCSGLPIVMMTAHASVTGAVDAMKEGACDYLEKPFEIETMLQTVRRALEANRLREEVHHQRATTMKDVGLLELVARSARMREVLRMVDRVATSGATNILLLGESGVGKGLVARALHGRSAGADRPFLHITCTALTETLLESELFGHEKGAFTDAKQLKRGLLELADGGTVFLDEIGDLSPGLQGKLLRFLEDRVFRRVGGVRDIQVGVRVIAATNKRLEAEVEAGRFRSDLYFRLKVIPIEIPPLRERREDIEPLAEHFVEHFNSDFRKQIGGFEPGTFELMRTYAWPGNVRELRNAIERAVLLGDGPLLGPADFPGEISSRGALPGVARGGIRLPAEGLDLEQVERDLVRQALELARGNRTHAARLLGMNRDQIRYRIEKFGLEQSAAGYLEQ